MKRKERAARVEFWNRPLEGSWSYWNQGEKKAGKKARTEEEPPVETRSEEENHAKANM